MNKPKRIVDPIIRVASHNKNVINVPPYLRAMQFNRYPPDNAVTFERWYMDNWSGIDERERTYLPIQWTALYCNNGYGNEPIMHTIQKFIDGLDKSKKYYTIVQYDDGILNNLDSLDIKVCAMAGPRIDFPLPLLCTPHKFNFDPRTIKKDITASFIGSLTHPIRANMINELKGKEGYYISTKHHDLREYCHILARSKYALCPRGYGQSSFRIQEAIDFGAVPIYISDEFVLPYDKLCLPVLFDVNQMSCTIDEFLQATSVNYKERLDVIEKNKYLFTYAGCKKEILQYLSNESDNDKEVQQPGTGGIQRDI